MQGFGCAKRGSPLFQAVATATHVVCHNGADEMNIILFSRRVRGVRHLNLNHPLAKSAVAGALLLMLGAAFTAGMQLGEQSSSHPMGGTPSEWARTLAEQKAEVASLRVQLQERVDALAARMGMMNAHVIRLDALGKRLTKMANIDNREFNFDSAPAAGGPEGDGVPAQVPDLTTMLSDLEERMAQRSAQLSALESVILARELREQIMPEGRPVIRGFISSYFGERQDPFTGHEAFHRGVDFAGDYGDQVVAVAAGVVTYAGEKSGFGHVVEVAHGDGYTTRYGHNQSNVVAVGDTVARGQMLAKMGSTGRSTGPHVHFEVLRDGSRVNPLSFVRR